MGHKLESSHTRVFVWFSALIFPFLKMLFMNRLEFFFLLRGFFVRIPYLKPEKNIGVSIKSTS